MNVLLPLALRRAGTRELKEFQSAHGLPPTGLPDEATQAALEPYLLGYRSVTIAPGDTLWTLARDYGATVEAIKTANPGIEPERLAPGSALIVPLGFPLVPTDVPMTAGLCAYCIRGLAARYPFCRSETLGQTAYGRPILTLVLGGGPRRVLYNGSHHANEWITTTLLLRFAEALADAYAAGGEVGGIPARLLWQLATIYMVPMVNPDGVDLVTGALGPGDPGYEQARFLGAYYPQIPFPGGWKANLMGVDLNLNYPAGWDEAREIKFAQGYTRPGPRDYVGRAPLDQRETAAMVSYTSLTGPAAVLAYHTQGQVIYWQFRDITVPGAEALGRELARVSGYALAETPYASSFAGYKDWFIQAYRRPGYTVEAGLGENPLPLSQFDEIYRDNLGILLTAALPPALGSADTSAG